MQMQMGMGAGNPAGFDATKAFKQERESLQLHSHQWKLQTVEYQFLGEPAPTLTAAVTTGLSSPSSATEIRSTTTKSRSSKFTKRRK